MYYVENTHPAIISLEVFDKVQAEMKRRRELGGRGNKSLNVTAFTSMIVCDNCGANYSRKTTRKGKNKMVYHFWTCQTKDKKGVAICPSQNVPEKVLKEVSAKVLQLETFDDDVFQSRVEKINVIGKDTLLLRYRNGTEVTEKWKSTARKDCWTPERKAQYREMMKGNRRRNRG